MLPKRLTACFRTKKMPADRKETIENTFKPITEPLAEIPSNMSTSNGVEDHVSTNTHSETLTLSKNQNEYLNKYWEHCVDVDTCYGPELVDDRWYLGNKELMLNDHDIVIGNKKFKTTTGLYELLLFKNPKHFTPTDHQRYKQILAQSGVHRNSRDRLRHQGCKEKYNKIIKPLFKTKVTRPTNSRVLDQYLENKSDSKNTAFKKKVINLKNSKPLEDSVSSDVAPEVENKLKCKNNLNVSISSKHPQKQLFKRTHLFKSSEKPSSCDLPDDETDTCSFVSNYNKNRY